MYLQDVILRQRDANSGWTSAADGTMEERRYPCQNWRNDVSVMLTSAGVMVEWAKYSAYGVPFGLPGADTDSDGDCDATDITQIQTWIDAPAYDVRADVDLDGDVDATDKTLAINNYQGTTSGWRVLSAASVANRIGYAGYQQDVNLDISHVRNRVLEPHLGRWMRRDPLGYVDGMGLYEYVLSSPTSSTDAPGLASNRGCTPRKQQSTNEYIPCSGGKWKKCVTCYRCRYSFERRQYIWDYNPDRDERKCGGCRFYHRLPNTWPTLKNACNDAGLRTRSACQMYIDDPTDVNCINCCAETLDIAQQAPIVPGEPNPLLQACVEDFCLRRLRNPILPPVAGACPPPGQHPCTPECPCLR